jgi:hypothetical protein
MSYFPHAFQKMLVALPKNIMHSAFNDTPGLTTTLTPGQVGIIGSLDNQIVEFTDLTTAVYADLPMVYLAQGSFHTTDRLGGSFHGGYQETVKTKGINPKYVSRFYVTEPEEATNDVWTVCAENCVLECETTYRLRVDIKGSPVLRTLMRNMYFTVDAYTGCCDDPDDPSAIDPNVVLLQWADRINEYPLTSPFVRALVVNDPTEVEVEYFTQYTLETDDETVIPVEGQAISGADLPAGWFVGTVTPVGGPATSYRFTVVDSEGNLIDISALINQTIELWTVIDSATYVPLTDAAEVAAVEACLVVVGAYVDTQFGDCSFLPTDKHDIEPIQLNLSVVDESGDPCVVSCLTATERQNAYQGKGYGETLLREYILFKRYLQEPWCDDVRLREITDNTTVSDLPRNAKYYVYHILHSVPRKSNSDGMLDNDQYLVKIVTAGRDADFEAWMDAYLVSANSGVQLEVIV